MIEYSVERLTKSLRSTKLLYRLPATILIGMPLLFVVFALLAVALPFCLLFDVTRGDA